MKQPHYVATSALCLVALGALTGCPPRSPQPGETRVFDGIEFQWCPPGTFAMGSPSGELDRDGDEALHEVTLTQGFWLSKYEVSQAQWEDLVGNNPSDLVGDDHPVEQVSWDDVQEFLIILNATTSGATYRLPTEAQWEYACRAGTTTRFYWGNDPNDTEIADRAWFDGNSGDETHPVGAKASNAWGLHDMGGNGAEWCYDWYGVYPGGPVSDPMGPASGQVRVIRGGSSHVESGECRSANRSFASSNLLDPYIGFRLLRAQT